MVTEPRAYWWSSYRSRIGEAAWGWLDIDPGYCGLGGTDAERRQRYARFAQDEAPPEEWELIQEAVQRGQFTGNDRFVAKWAGSRADALSGVGGADLGKVRMSRQNKSVPFSPFQFIKLKVALDEQPDRKCT
jgi:hypothetical protein